MRLYQRVALALAERGITGVAQSARRRLLRTHGKASDPQLVVLKEAYRRLVESFRERTSRIGIDGFERYYWYHTIDLGGGLVTPGDYDYRATLPSFKFPDNMTGLSVLDVGSATGFFAFEFERRGADVTSIEIPSIEQWDAANGDDRDPMIQEYLAEFGVTTVKELHRLHLDGPFEFCRDRLHSHIRRYHSTIYQLSPTILGRRSFDLVFIGDVLLHLISPFGALGAVAPLCADTLVISQDIGNQDERRPLMVYCGGEQPGGATYWLPNFACLESMLRRLGFRTISVVGHNAGVYRRDWVPYHRAIIHAKK